MDDLQPKEEIRLSDFIDPDEKLPPDRETVIQEMPNGAKIPKHDKYKNEYDEIAFQELAKPNGSKTSACVALRCSRPTFNLWLEKHPTFKRAVEAGLLVGESRFRSKLYHHAFSPAKDVNNGLIKIIASNVYGISDEEAKVIINNNQNNTVVADNETAALYKSALEAEEKIEGEGWGEEE